MRLFAVSSRIFFSVVVLLICSSQVWAVAKSEIVIYDYAGIATATEGKFGMFRGILDSKLEVMKRELPAEFEELQHISALESSYQNRATSMSSEGIRRWLKNRATALCLLTGTIASDDDQNYLVISKFYLGELQQYLPFDPIMIPLQIKISEFSNIQDSHSLVIFYALAMDAKRLGFDSHLVARLLALAREKLADIDTRSDRLAADLEVLRQAIDRAESDLLGGGDGR